MNYAAAFSTEKKSGRDGEYLEITGGGAGTGILFIPEKLDGLPVSGIGRSAFSGREDLKEVYLPDSIRYLNPFAFYHCPNLKKMSLSDSIEDFCDGAVRQCRSLSEIRVAVQRNSFRVVREILQDFALRLRVVLLWNGQEIRLTFPEYAYTYVEDTRARAIHHKIEGAGYPYRECVSRMEIRFHEYDRLFYRVTAYDVDTSVEIAFDRLMTPFELEPADAEQYQAYLNRQASQVLGKLIQERDEERMAFYLSHCNPPRDAVAAALCQASAARETALCGLLMEYQRRQGAENGGTFFSLDD